MKKKFNLFWLLIIGMLVLNFLVSGEVIAKTKTNLKPISIKNKKDSLSKVNAVIKNEGDRRVNNFKITLWINGSSFRQNISSIAAESEKTVSIATNINSPGEYNYSLLVDSLAQVRESSENDNKITSTVNISRVKLTVNYPEKIRTKEEIRVRGTAPEEAQKVMVSVDGWPLTNQKGKELIPVKDGSYNLKYAFSSRGRNRRLEVKAVDGQGRVIKRIENRLEVDSGSGDSAQKYVFSANESKNINLGVIEEGNSAVVAVSPLNLSTSEVTYYGNLKVEYKNGGSSFFFNKTPTDSFKNKQSTVEKQSHYNKAQFEVSRKMRKLENRLIRGGSRNQRFSAVKNKSGVQAGRSFYVAKKGLVIADLKKITDRALIYVEDGIEIADSALERLGSEFDNQIFPTDMEYFAQHKYGKYYDIDNNGKTIILISDLSSESRRGTLFGFFNPCDIVGDGVYRSNNADMFYLNSKVLNKDTKFKQVLATLAHEFQHLIFFMEKLAADRNCSDTWINEGFAVLANYLNGYSDLADDSRVKSYFKKPNLESLTSWNGNLQDYGASGLFACYLYKRYGREMIAEIITGKKRPRGIIGRDQFYDFYLDWLLTNQISSEVGNGIYSYPFNFDLKPKTKRFIGSGEKFFPIYNTGVKYFRIDGTGSEVKLELELPTKAGVAIYK